MKITKRQLELLIDNLMGIEIKSVKDVIQQGKLDKAYIKDNPDIEKQLLMATSYLKGLQRAKEIFVTVLRDAE